jgi:hypothetical protein
VRSALVALVALALSLAAFAWAPAPLLWVVAIGLVACGSTIVRSSSSVARMIAIYACASLLAVGGFEASLWIRRDPPHEPEFQGTYAKSGYYYVDDDVLGYAPKPGATVTSTKLVDGQRIYSVTYGIDENGLRRVAAPQVSQPIGSIVFFGCSFTFGEGVEDDEAMPSVVARAVGDRYRVYNFGFHGYGPHQMLASIESGRFASIVREPPVLVLYQALWYHIARAEGRTEWDRHGPRYRLREDGGVERDGHFDDGVGPIGATAREWLERALVYRELFGSERPLRKPDVALFVAIVRTARDRIRELYPNARFEVLLWGRQQDGLARKIEAGLVEIGIPVHRVHEILPGYDDDPVRYQLSPLESHPNAATQQAIGRWVAESLVPAARDGR